MGWNPGAMKVRHEHGKRYLPYLVCLPDAVSRHNPRNPAASNILLVSNEQVCAVRQDATNANNTWLDLGVESVSSIQEPSCPAHLF